MVQPSEVRVGVIGVGIMGERHARVFSEIPNSRLVGVFDLDANRAVEVARRYGGVAFHVVEDLFRSVDAVSIASPTSSHADLCLHALSYERHLLIEKPMAGSLAESHQIVSHAKSHPASLVMVGHIERFNPTVIELRRLLKDRTINSMTMRRMSPFDNRALDTDVIHDLMIHDIDLLLDLLGDDIEAIDAVGTPVVSTLVDQAMVQMTMASGAHVDLIASRVANRKVRMIEVHTDEGRIIADLLGKSIEIRSASGTARGIAGSASYIDMPSTEPLRLEMTHFIDCILSNEAVSPNVFDGHRSMIYANCIQSLITRGLVASQRASVATDHTK